MKIDHEELKNLVSRKVVLQLLDWIRLIKNDDNPDYILINLLQNSRDIIIKNTIVTIYYAYYTSTDFSSSLREHLKEHLKEHSDSNIWDANYKQLQYTYKKYRTNKDENMRVFTSSMGQLPQLYAYFEPETTGEKVKRTEGHAVSDFNYDTIEILNKYDIFKALRDKRLHDVKKISQTEFKTRYAPQINDVYDYIIDMYHAVDLPHFKTLLQYYSIEKNCAFELCYLIAKVLSPIKLKTLEKSEEFKVFSNIFVFNNGIYDIQNSIVWGMNQIIEKYDYENVKAEHICKNNFIINEIINEIAHSLCGVEIVIDEQTDAFSKNLIFEESHINTKDWDSIKIKYFRDLYNPTS